MDTVRRSGGGRLIRFLILAAMLMGAAAAAFGGSSAAADVAQSGEIVGVIDSCGAGGTNGILVHIPGESFTVFTGPTGAFRLRFVPVGTYKVRIVFPDHPPELIEGVVVERKTVTDLGTVVVCPDADGDGYAADVDCNDLNPTVYPGAEETCDGFDNDCNGTVDEGCQTCTDSDHDSFFAQAQCGTRVDCDDTNRMVNPGAVESCDGIDNDCDAMVDEDFDRDRDGFAVCGGDCDDGNPRVNPAVPELCNDGIDNNCNGQAEEGCLTCSDRDGDGFFGREGCGTAVDCDDDNRFKSPGLAENCFDAWDNDCDGTVDEPECIPCFDSDRDFYFDRPGCGTEVDCDDSDPRVGAPVPELCDGLDNDCDDLIDENFDLRSDPHNCGACNHVCSSGRCVDGQCMP